MFLLMSAIIAKIRKLRLKADVIKNFETFFHDSVNLLILNLVPKLKLRCFFKTKVMATLSFVKSSKTGFSLIFLTE